MRWWWTHSGRVWSILGSLPAVAATLGEQEAGRQGVPG